MNKLVALKNFSYGKCRIKRGMEFTPKNRSDERVLTAVLLAKKVQDIKQEPCAVKGEVTFTILSKVDSLRAEYERVSGEPADKRWSQFSLERRLSELSNPADDANG